jgi:hypothetical protein
LRALLVECWYSFGGRQLCAFQLGVWLKGVNCPPDRGLVVGSYVPSGRGFVVGSYVSFWWGVRVRQLCAFLACC